MPNAKCYKMYGPYLSEGDVISAHPVIRDRLDSMYGKGTFLDVKVYSGPMSAGVVFAPHPSVPPPGLTELIDTPRCHHRTDRDCQS